MLSFIKNLFGKKEPKEVIPRTNTYDFLKTQDPQKKIADVLRVPSTIQTRETRTSMREDLKKSIANASDLRELDSILDTYDTREKKTAATGLFSRPEERRVGVHPILQDKEISKLYKDREEEVKKNTQKSILEEYYKATDQKDYAKAIEKSDPETIDKLLKRTPKYDPVQISTLDPKLSQGLKEEKEKKSLREWIGEQTKNLPIYGTDKHTKVEERFKPQTYEDKEGKRVIVPGLESEMDKLTIRRDYPGQHPDDGEWIYNRFQYADPLILNIQNLPEVAGRTAIEAVQIVRQGITTGKNLIKTGEFKKSISKGINETPEFNAGNFALRMGLDQKEVKGVAPRFINKIIENTDKEFYNEDGTPRESRWPDMARMTWAIGTAAYTEVLPTILDAWMTTGLVRIGAQGILKITNYNPTTEWSLRTLNLPVNKRIITEKAFKQAIKEGVTKGMTEAEIRQYITLTEIMKAQQTALRAAIHPVEAMRINAATKHLLNEAGLKYQLVLDPVKKTWYDPTVGDPVKGWRTTLTTEQKLYTQLLENHLKETGRFAQAMEDVAKSILGIKPGEAILPRIGAERALPGRQPMGPQAGAVAPGEFIPRETLVKINQLMTQGQNLDAVARALNMPRTAIEVAAAQIARGALRDPGETLYHQSDDVVGKPEFDAFFGNDKFMEQHPGQFGEGITEIKLPEGAAVLDLDINAPEPRAFLEEMAKIQWPEDTIFQKTLREKGISDLSDDVYDIWADKRIASNLLKQPEWSHIDAVKLGNEYMIPKRTIDKVQTPGTLYHGTNEFSAELIRDGGFKFGYESDRRLGAVQKELGEAIYFSEKSNVGSYGGSVVEAVLMPGAKIQSFSRQGFREYLQKHGLNPTDTSGIRQHFINKGIDGVKTEREVAVYNLDAIKTKSQLTDLATPKIKEKAPVPTFTPPKDLSTKLLNEFAGMPEIIKRGRFDAKINEVKNKKGISKYDEGLVRKAAEEQGNYINLPQLSGKIRAELVELKPKVVDGPPEVNKRYGENVSEEGQYQEIIYQGPVETDAIEKHYRGRRDEFPRYFSHVRLENLPPAELQKEWLNLKRTVEDARYRRPSEISIKELKEARGKLEYMGMQGTERKIWEIQSDLMQKNIIDQIFPVQVAVTVNGNKILVTRNRFRVEGGMKMFTDFLTDPDYEALKKYLDYESTPRTFWASGSVIVRPYEDTIRITIKEAEAAVKSAQRALDRKIKQLKAYDPYMPDTASHLRTFREEVSRAAKDGKETLLTPTGETAMVIEKLGVQHPDEHWQFNEGNDILTPNDIEVGMEVWAGGDEGSAWIITGIVQGGKFDAIPKERINKYNEEGMETYLEVAKEGYSRTVDKYEKDYAVTQAEAEEMIEEQINQFKVDLDRYEETFDLSGKIDTNHFVYKLHENAIPKEAKRMGLEIEKVTRPGEDGSNYEWWKHKIPSELKNYPTEAFGAFAGFEVDEDGNVTYDPAVALMSMLAIGSMKMGPRKIGEMKILRQGGMTVPQIAKTMNIPKELVANTLKQQLKLLQKEVTKMSPDEAEAEAIKRLDKFRKNAGLMVDKEGAGTKTIVEKGPGETVDIFTQFSMKRLKGEMADRAGQSRRYAHEMIYEVDPEYKMLYDKGQQSDPTTTREIDVDKLFEEPPQRNIESVIRPERDPLEGIPNNSRDVVFHQTGSEQEKRILEEGFKVGEFAEKRGAVYAAGNKVNDKLYSRTGEGDVFEGQQPAKIPIDIRGLNLYDATKHGISDEMGAAIIRGELNKLPEGYDGAIKFLPNGDVYEVALPAELATERIITKEEALRRHKDKTDISKLTPEQVRADIDKSKRIEEARKTILSKKQKILQEEFGPSDELDFKIKLEEQKRGKIPWEQTARNAEKIKLDMNKLATIPKGTIFNAETMEAAKQELRGWRTAVKQTRENVAADPNNIGMKVLLEEMERLLARVSINIAAVMSEMGRALNVLKYDGSVERITRRVTRNVETTMRKLDDPGRENLQMEIERLDVTNPEEIHKFLMKFSDARLIDKIVEFYKTMLYSAPTTQVFNFISSAGMIGIDVPIRVIAGGFDAVRAQITGTPREVYAYEAIRMLTGGYNSLRAAGREGLNSLKEEGYKGGARALAKETGEPEIGGKRIPAIKGKWFRSTGGWVWRIANAADNTERTLMIGMQMDSLAYRMAKQEGLEGIALAERIEQIKSNPPKELIEELIIRGERVMGYEELRGVFDRINQFRFNVPASQLVMPFYRGIINYAFVEAYRLTPARFITTPIKEKMSAIRVPLETEGMSFLEKQKIRATAMFAEDMKTDPRMASKFARPEERGRMIFGTAIAAIMLGMIMEERLEVTGPAPGGQAERDTFYGVGKKPYSFRYKKKNGEWSNWIEFRRMQPYASILFTMNQIHKYREMIKKNPDGLTADMLEDRTVEMINQVIRFVFTEQAAMQGVTGLIEALDGGAYDEGTVNSAARFLRNQVSGFIPNALFRYQISVDPTLYLTHNLWEEFDKKIPGRQADLIPRRNAFGFVVERSETPRSRMFNPYRYSEPTEDPVYNELERLNTGIGFPTKSIAGTKLTTKEYDLFLQDYGPRLYKSLAELIRSEAYKDYDDFDKLEIINEEKDYFRKETREVLFDDYYYFQEEMRYAESLGLSPEKQREMAAKETGINPYDEEWRENFENELEKKVKERQRLLYEGDPESYFESEREGVVEPTPMQKQLEKPERKSLIKDLLGNDNRQ